MNSSFVKTIERLFLVVAAVAIAIAAFGGANGDPRLWQWSTIVATAGLAIGLGAVHSLRTFRFTAWIVASVVTAMWVPQVFQPFAPDSASYKLLLLLLIQAVMFGMGTQMSIRDFVGVARAPWPVAVGLLCQFTIMPLVGFGLAIVFQLPPEIAAGMVLIGSCSSGLASNVMAYIGRANLALSITLTACATLLAPIVTPFWMKLLAGSLLAGTTIELSFVKMMVVIIKIVIVPTGAALIHDYLKHASPAGRRVVWGLSLAGIALAIAMAAGGWSGFIDSIGGDSEMYAELLMWILGGVAFGAIYHRLTLLAPAIDSWMPFVAMAGIIYVTGMTTAEGREHLIAVGVALVAAAALHNLLGFCLGYWMSRLLGMDAMSARTVAFEVGMQNGGMATGLANEMGKLGTLGLPAAIFIAWMNVTGSLLANFWRRRPIQSAVQDNSV